MGFWKKIFSRTEEKQDIQVANQSTIATEPEEDEQELKYDDNGWLTFPDGIKYKNNYDVETDIFEEIDYQSDELYSTGHNSEGKGFEDGVYPTEIVFTCYWELFKNKLVYITRQDDQMITREDINNCIKSQRKYINLMSEIPGMPTDAMINLEHGIKEQGIRQSFIENIFNKKSEDNCLDARKFTFKFRDGYLCDCLYDGYAFKTWSLLMDIGVEEYYSVFKQLGGGSDRRIKKLIDRQAECYSKIDKDILLSHPIMNRFAYVTGGLSINYIAIAAIYQQCDVSQDIFIESTFGNYVFLSKTTNNGITTTRINAYNNTITFYNGHSMLEQSISTEQEQSLSIEQNEELDKTDGFIYVMINPSLEGMVKIGKTTRDPNDRVKELSSATGVPTPFILVFQKKFKNCHYTEKAIHQYLEKNGYRISDNREFFKMPVTDAINVVQQFYDIENEEQKKDEVSCEQTDNITNTIDNTEENNANYGTETLLDGGASTDSTTNPHGNSAAYDDYIAAQREEQAAYDDFIASLDMEKD